MRPCTLSALSAPAEHPDGGSEPSDDCANGFAASKVSNAAWAIEASGFCFSYANRYTHAGVASESRFARVTEYVNAFTGLRIVSLPLQGLAARDVE